MKLTEREKRFRICFVRELLNLCSDKKGEEIEGFLSRQETFIKQEIKRVIGEDEVEFKVNGKQKLEYKASDSYYNPVRNQLKAQQRRKAGIK